MAWSGTAATIPTGWRLCDGTSLTPVHPYRLAHGQDLRSRFIFGSANLGTAGGASTAALSTDNLPAHSHTASSSFAGNNMGSHSHSVSDPGHNHLYFGDDGCISPGGYTRQIAINYDANSSGSGNGGSFVTKNMANANAGQATGITLGSTSIGVPTGSVSTTISSTGSGSPFSILPPYLALCYIMKA
jgi:microcystin-dependent protein